MQSILKKIFNNWVPPALAQVIRGKTAVSWHGDYSSWEDARKLSTGYEHGVILDKVKKASLKVKTGKAVFERDSVIFYETQYAWPILAGLLRVASANNNRLCMLDFGGSLASSYYQNRCFLSILDELKWCVVEQKNVVDCGKLFFEDRFVRFYYDIQTCVDNEHIDVVLMSSVLPYLEKPYEVLEDILSTDVDHIIIDRTPFLKSGNEDRLTVQNVSPSIYKASYPAWFFNKPKFLNFIKQRYNMIAEFDCQDQANINSEYKGFIFAKHGLQS